MLPRKFTILEKLCKPVSLPSSSLSRCDEQQWTVAESDWQHEMRYSPMAGQQPTSNNKMDKSSVKIHDHNTCTATCNMEVSYKGYQFLPLV